MHAKPVDYEIACVIWYRAPLVLKRDDFHSPPRFFRCWAFMTTERRARESRSRAALIFSFCPVVGRSQIGLLHKEWRFQFHATAFVRTFASSRVHGYLRGPALPPGVSSITVRQPPRAAFAVDRHDNAADATGSLVRECHYPLARAIRAQTRARGGDGRLMANAWHDKGGKTGIALRSITRSPVVPLISSRLVACL